MCVLFDLFCLLSHPLIVVVVLYLQEIELVFRPLNNLENGQAESQARYLKTSSNATGM